MKKSIHPGFATALLVIIVAIAVYFVYQGAQPHRETPSMSQEEIYKQMGAYSKTGKPPVAGKQPEPAQTGH